MSLVSFPAAAAALDEAQAQAVARECQPVLTALQQIVLDKPEAIRLALTCLLAGGHLLLQDLPGMGKTTLAESLGRVIGLSYRRIQFTSDMLPADILGLSIYNTQTREFDFRPGPIFTQLLLADEINRTSPKTQSALLEAMEEQQVTQDGQTRRLPEPFFVIATQNPVQQSGTYPLPESQLDRFLMCLSLGYPSELAERDLLMGVDRRQLMLQLQAQISPAQLLQWRQQSGQVYVSEAVVSYLQRLVAATRQRQQHAGLSTRGLLALKRAAQAYALLSGRHFTVPEDVQAVFVAVTDHRIGAVMGQASPATHILQSVPVLV